MLRDLTDRMNVVAAETQRTITAGQTSGLSREAAVLAALIGVLGYLRVEGLPEAHILKLASEAVPVRYQLDGVMMVKE